MQLFRVHKLHTLYEVAVLAVVLPGDGTTGIQDGSIRHLHHHDTLSAGATARPVRRRRRCTRCACHAWYCHRLSCLPPILEIQEPYQLVKRRGPAQDISLDRLPTRRHIIPIHTNPLLGHAVCRMVCTITEVRTVARDVASTPGAGLGFDGSLSVRLRPRV